ASLLSPLINGASTSAGTPSSAVGDEVVGDSGNGAAATGGSSGGGGTTGLWGLLACAVLLLCFKRKNTL
ncbi:MAG: hypothetical protein ACK5Q1_04375, partial [Limnobacter sp.]